MTRQFDYYRIKGVTNTNVTETIKKYNNSDTYWWFRTASEGQYFNFEFADYREEALPGPWFYASSNHGVSPAFRVG